jgi:hypothetical protein
MGPEKADPGLLRLAVQPETDADPIVEPPSVLNHGRADAPDCLDDYLRLPGFSISPVLSGF